MVKTPATAVTARRIIWVNDGGGYYRGFIAGSSIAINITPKFDTYAPSRKPCGYIVSVDLFTEHRHIEAGFALSHVKRLALDIAGRMLDANADDNY